jgi:hypothetical protein
MSLIGLALAGILAAFQVCFTLSTAGPLAGILNAAQKKSTFNLDNLIEVYTFVVY